MADFENEQLYNFTWEVITNKHSSKTEGSTQCVMADFEMSNCTILLERLSQISILVKQKGLHNVLWQILKMSNCTINYLLERLSQISILVKQKGLHNVLWQILKMSNCTIYLRGYQLQISILVKHKNLNIDHIYIWLNFSGTKSKLSQLSFWGKVRRISISMFTV